MGVFLLTLGLVLPEVGLVDTLYVLGGGEARRVGVFAHLRPWLA